VRKDITAYRWPDTTPSQDTANTRVNHYSALEVKHQIKIYLQLEGLPWQWWLMLLLLLKENS